MSAFWPFPQHSQDFHNPSHAWQQRPWPQNIIAAPPIALPISTEFRPVNIVSRRTDDGAFAATNGQPVSFNHQSQMQSQALNGRPDAITADHIFRQYPIRTPAGNLESSPLLLATAEDSKQNFEFQCEIPGRCARQYQRVLADRRHAVSDLFGRNKSCTFGLPRLISICRMHYQANCFTEHWPRQRIAFALEQLERNEQDVPGLQYTISIKDSEAKRLVTHLHGEPEAQTPSRGSRRGRSSKSDLLILQCIWKTWMGQHRSRGSCISLLTWCYQLLDAGLCSSVVAIELLAELQDPRHAVNLGSSQKRLLQHIEWRDCGYLVPLDREQVIRDMQDSKLVEAEGEDSEREQQQQQRRQQLASHDSNVPMANAVDGTGSQMQEKLPMPIPTLVLPRPLIQVNHDAATTAPSSPSPHCASQNSSFLTNTTSRAPSPGPRPMHRSSISATANAGSVPVAASVLQALTASIEASISLSQALPAECEVKTPLLSLMQQARVRVRRARCMQRRRRQSSALQRNRPG